MKLGIFSDVHGNLRALEEVLRVFDAMGVERAYCLGDLVGYYHQSPQVVRRVMGASVTTIMGNHEACLTGVLKKSREYEEERNLAGPRGLLSPKEMEWLGKLPESLAATVGGARLAMYHGSPWNPLEGYVHPDSEEIRRVEGMEVDVIFLGHTHRQMDLTVGKVRVINPGSVGQPRDGDPRAQACIFDGSKDIKFLRLEYDLNSAILEAEAAGVREDALRRWRGL